MSTLKPTIDAGMREAIAKKYGKTFTLKLSDLLKIPVSNNVDTKHLESLQMAEIAFRLRLQVSEMIREYRKLEQQWHLLHTEMEYVRSEMDERRAQIRRPGFGEIRGMYALYKEVWRDFLYALHWAEKLQGLKGKERAEFRASIISKAQKQARTLYRAEKASQLANAMLARARQPRSRKTLWKAL